MIEEAHRLAAVHALRLADEPLDAPMLALLRATRSTLRVPAAAISIIRGDEVVARGEGWPVQRVPRPISLAGQVVAAHDVVTVENLAASPALSGSPAVRHGLTFMAGAPIRAPSGILVGALVVAGPGPRCLDATEVRMLREAALVADALLQRGALRRALDGLAGQDVIELPPERRTLLAAALGEEVPVDESIQVSRWSSHDPELLQLLLRKGTPGILRHLGEHPRSRFTDLLRALPGMNQRTLATRLRELQERGLIVREAFDESPPRVEYRVADDAKGLVRGLLEIVGPDPQAP